ncbi:lipase maturation factor family protein [Streptomyces sp. NPDC006704]|uniref:lipase maturation factor family protein n=1 Tax=Streptomyces sp. NPDC006704 TaxID=3364760 RepID=UPI0036823794
MQWFSSSAYWLGRLVFQRSLAVVYVVAFLVAARQFRALIGERGMLPVPAFVERVPFRRAPSIFQLRYSDRWFASCAWAGALLAAAVAAGAADALPLWAAMVCWAVLWALYLSIVNVGQTWYGFGWESLLLEAGFLAVFLGNDDVAPPVIVMWLLRWVLFRVEFGAGLIKMRGDPCWRDLTCLYYHHETQPMPGPLSWFFHHLPKPVHRVEVAANHVVQLVVPLALFTPQPVAGIAALLVVCTQLWLVLSGNFAWLNWLTIVLAASAVDGPRVANSPALAPPPLWYESVVLLAAALVLALSYRPARNLVSRGQRMNTTYEPLHLVNSYGAFGSVTRIRHEVVVEGTAHRGPPGAPEPPHPPPGPHEAQWYKQREGRGHPVLRPAGQEISPDTPWREYEFRGKPGDPRHWPRQFAPFHLRLDWLLWFVALSPSYGAAWFDGFLLRLLLNDRDTLRLLRRNPFPDRPPVYVRARLYQYRFTTWPERRETRACWHRTYLRDLTPVVRLRDLPEGVSLTGPGE